MSRQRDIRRCALQALYQLDSGNADHPDVVLDSLHHSPGDAQTHREGFDLALAAWESRGAADERIGRISTDWPTHRQPVVDRNILRLAYHELVTGHTPPKVVINEAIELAREFSTEKSPLFINGILDKLYRSLREDAAPADPDTVSESPRI